MSGCPLLSGDRDPARSPAYELLVPFPLALPVRDVTSWPGVHCLFGGASLVISISGARAKGWRIGEGDRRKEGGGASSKSMSESLARCF